MSLFTIDSFTIDSLPLSIIMFIFSIVSIITSSFGIKRYKKDNENKKIELVFFIIKLSLSVIFLVYSLVSLKNPFYESGSDFTGSCKNFNLKYPDVESDTGRFCRRKPNGSVVSKHGRVVTKG